MQYGKDACSRMQFHRYSEMRSKVYSNTVVLFTLNHLGQNLAPGTSLYTVENVGAKLNNVPIPCIT